jgi:hypothetical protein
MARALSATLSDVQSYLLDMSAQISNVESLIDSNYLLNKSDLSDIHSAATEARKILRNRLNVDSATGVARLYNDNNTTVLMSGTVAADGTSTLRTRLA